VLANKAVVERNLALIVNRTEVKKNTVICALEVKQLLIVKHVGGLYHSFNTAEKALGAEGNNNFALIATELFVFVIDSVIPLTIKVYEAVTSELGPGIVV
jgi:hypothetical protein